MLHDVQEVLPPPPPDPIEPAFNHPPGRPIWVFGYGSLMWNPGFPFSDRRPARLHGFHRRFCVYSQRYRGTPEAPGLVLGLDRGGSCLGMAFRIDGPDVAGVLTYLWQREMVTMVYRPTRVSVQLVAEDGDPPTIDDGGRVLAAAFVVDRQHRQYCSGLSHDRAADLISTRSGSNGPNADYLFNTVEHLDTLGIRDTALHALARSVRQRQGGD